jgi:hypothetical protein
MSLLSDQEPVSRFITSEASPRLSVTVSFIFLGPQLTSAAFDLAAAIPIS